MAVNGLRMSVKPLIGVPADRRMLDPHPFHVVGEKYLTAVRDGADALPLTIPALGASIHPDDILARIDGLLLTGSYSNVEPHHYDGNPSRPGTRHDPHRGFAQREPAHHEQGDRSRQQRPFAQAAASPGHRVAEPGGRLARRGHHARGLGLDVAAFIGQVVDTTLGERQPFHRRWLGRGLEPGMVAGRAPDRAPG